MKLLSLVLFVTFEGLFADYASSQCISLQNTSLNNCFQAGFSESEFNRSRPLQNISNLVTSMKTKFDSCSNSSLSTLMACSLFVPKCSTASSRRLPCEVECRNFFRGCQHGSPVKEGLMALLRGLCDLLPPCSPLSNNSNPEAHDNVMCKRLNIKQCAGAGYSLTTVPSAYQKLVESSAIFRNSSINSTLRKIICMEVAPPCDYKNNLTLYVPCKSTCDSAYNESKQQFLDVFKSNDYCSVFPTNKSTAEQEYCALQAWPDVGYWPSDLWKSILTAEPQQTSTVNTSMPTGTSEPTTKNRTDNGTTKEPVHSSTTVTHPGASLTTTTQGKTVPTTETREVNTKAVTTSKKVPPTPKPRSNETTTASKPVPTNPLKISLNASSTAISENKGNTTMAKSVSTTIVQAKTTTSLVGGGNRTLETSLKVSSTTPKPVPTTPLKVSPNAPSTAVSENKGNTTMAKSVSTTIVQAKTTTTLVTTPKASPNATVHGGRNSTIASSLKVSSTTSSMAVSGSNKSTTLPTSSMSTTKMRGSMTLTVQTSSIVSPSARSATETGIQTSTTNAATTVSTTISHGAIPVPTSVVPSATSTLRPETKGKVPGNQTKTGKKLSPGVIVAIVFGILAGLAAIVVGVIFLRRYKKRKAQYSHSLMVDMDEL